MKKILFAFVIALMVAVLSVAVSAEIALTFTIEDVYTLDTDEPAKAIVAHIADTEGSLQGLKTRFSFDNNIIVPVDAVDGTVSEDFSADAEVGSYPFDLGNVTSRKELELTPNYPKFVFDGENSSLDIEVYYSSSFDTSDFVAWTMYFKFADGKSEADLTSDSFKVEFVEYGNGIKVDNHFHYYGHENASYNDISVTNNVVPEATVITIPVQAGDKIYLQDGTVATAEAAGDYEVPATVGYVAVNTGKTAQVTYYVDGTSATAVHTNGVVGSDELAIRAVSDDDVDEDGDIRNGLRFKMGHNSTTRTEEGHEVTEVGFLMTVESNKVTEVIGTDPVLTMDMTDTGMVLKGKAFSTETGEDKAFNTEDEEFWIITGVFYNIPLKEANVTIDIVSRPYYIVDGKVVYGEQTEATLYDVAKSVKEGAGFDALPEYLQNYINEILELVDGEETPIVEDEVIIDISGLYSTN